VPLGLLAIALIFFILRRYLKHKALSTASAIVYFPPDPINPFATQVFLRAELDTIPNTIAELDGNSVPKELDGAESAVTNPKRPVSVVSELEGSPGKPSVPTNRTSLSTTINEARWSDVSSLAPPFAHRATVARPSIAESLQSTTQQHHGPVEKTLIAPRPHASHRLSRPTSGLQHAIQLSEEDTSLTPESGTVGINEQVSDNAQKVHEDKQANEARETHKGEPSLNLEETNESDGDAVAAVAQNSEKSEEDETAHHGESSHENSTVAQASGEMHAVEKSYEGTIGSENEDPPRGATKGQAGDKADEGESAHQGPEAHEVDAKTQSEQ